MAEETEYHVASFIAHAQTDTKDAVAERIGTIEGVEIHAVSDEGKIVFTVEAESQKHIAAKTDDIRFYDGVLTLSPIYHQFLTEKAS